MPSKDGSRVMPWEPDPDRVVRVLWIGSAFWLLVAIVSAIGEIRGWWGLVSQIGMTAGTVLSAIVALAAYVYGAGKGQVNSVHEAVGENGRTLVSIDQALSGHEGVLEVLAGSEGVVDELDGINEAITGEEGMIHELDVIQLELDRQTGALDQQIQLLGEIRDRL